jgi:phage gp36-like protein
MPYITKQDLVGEIGEEKLMQLTDDAKVGAVNDEVVSKVIEYATGTFEMYARRRYSLPVPATKKVKSICVDLALNKLDRRRAKNGESLKMVQDSYKEIERQLEAISTGKAALDVPAAEETATNPGGGDRVLSGPAKPATFSDEKL